MDSEVVIRFTQEGEAAVMRTLDNIGKSSVQASQSLDKMMAKLDQLGNKTLSAITNGFRAVEGILRDIHSRLVSLTAEPLTNSLREANTQAVNVAAALRRFDNIKLNRLKGELSEALGVKFLGRRDSSAKAALERDAAKQFAWVDKQIAAMNKLDETERKLAAARFARRQKDAEAGAKVLEKELKDLDRAFKARERLERNQSRLPTLRVDRSADVGVGQLSRVPPAADRATSALLTFRRVLLGLGVGFTLRGVFNELDKVGSIRQKIEAVAQEGENTNQTFQKLRTVANGTGSDLEDVVQVYQKLNTAQEDLGINQDQVIRVVDLFNKTLRLSGATAVESAQANLQFSQSVGIMKIQGDEFRAIAKDNPVLLDIIAQSLGKTRGELIGLIKSSKDYKAENVAAQFGKTADELEELERRSTNLKPSEVIPGLGVTRTQLRRMKADAGEFVLDIETVLNAMFRAGNQIDSQFSKLGLRPSQSLAVLRNNFLNLLNEFEKSTGVVQKLSDVILVLAENVEVLAAVLTGLAIAVLPLLLGKLAALGAALLLNPFGITAVSVGALTGTLVYFRNEMGLAADGTFTFTDAVYTLNDAISALLVGLKTFSASEIVELFKLGSGITPLEVFSEAFGQARKSQLSPEFLPNQGYESDEKSSSLGLGGMWLKGVKAQAEPLMATLDFMEQRRRGIKLEQQRIQALDNLARATGRVTETEIQRRTNLLLEQDAQRELKELEQTRSKLSPLQSGAVSLQSAFSKFGDQSRKLAEFRKLAELQLKSELAQRTKIVQKSQAELELEKASLDAAERAANKRQVSNDPFAETGGQRPVSDFTGVNQLAASVKQSLGTLKSDIQQSGQDLIDSVVPEGLKDRIVDAFSPIPRAVEQTVAKLNTLANTAGTFERIGSEIDRIVNSFRASVVEVAAFIGDALGTVVGFVENAIKRVLAEIVGMVEQIIARIGGISIGGKALFGGIGGTPLTPPTIGGGGPPANPLQSLVDRFGGPGGTTFQDAGRAADQALAAQAAKRLADEQRAAAAAGQALNDELRQTGQLGPPAFNRSADAARNLGGAAQDTGNLMQQFIGSTLSNLENAFVQFAQTGKFDFKSLVNAMIADLTRLLFRMLIMQPLMNFFGGLFGVPFGGFGGAFAGGGQVGTAAGFSGGGIGASGPVGGFTNLGFGFGSGSCGPGGCKGFATGGLVAMTKSYTGFASGGMTTGPGTSTSDRLITLTSPGEFIVNAAATKANLPVLDYINQGGVIGDTKSTAVNYAPTIVVNVQGGGGATNGAEQGNAAAKAIDTKIKQQFEELLVKAMRPGGTLETVRR